VARARRLAELVMAEKCLLVLDGLEPLQHPTSVKGGELKDRGMARFLKVLSQQLETQWPGLCIVTSRQPLVEVANTAQVWPPLTIGEAGSRSCSTWRTRPQEGLAQVRRRIGRPLSVTLLGTYLPRRVAYSTALEIQLACGQAEGGMATTPPVDREGPRRIHRQAARTCGQRRAVSAALVNVVGLFDCVPTAVPSRRCKNPSPASPRTFWIKDGAPLSTSSGPTVPVALTASPTQSPAPAGTMTTLTPTPLSAAMARRSRAIRGLKAGHELFDTRRRSPSEATTAGLQHQPRVLSAASAILEPALRQARQDPTGLALMRAASITRG
jgi:hypothetical protein